MPVVVAFNKLDCKSLPSEDEQRTIQEMHDQIARSILVAHYEDCSAARVENVQPAFFQAFKAFLYPLKPLYDPSTRVFEAQLHGACLITLSVVLCLVVSETEICIRQGAELRLPFV